jgi:NNP family nitrate/nitrite transporter-like MFS transporter
MVNSTSSGSNYKWYVLTLGTLTHTFVMAIPWMSLPVLFKEISEDLDLSLVQVGTVWGMFPLAGMFVVLLGGLLGDRFGVKRTLTAICFLTGLSVALIGLSNSFFSLAATMFLFGLLGINIPTNVHKAAGIWFPGQQLGLANGIAAMGMGLGFTVGSMISATVLSPLLGGWRNVMFLYGAISVGMSVFWLLSRSGPGQSRSSASTISSVPFRQALSRVVGIRGVWFLGLSIMGQMACIQGVTGYLSLYLQDIGWTAASADGSLAAANAAATLATIPIAFLSDRLGSRKIVLFGAVLITIIGTGLLSVAGGVLIWVLVIMALIPRDGFMAVLVTTLTETEGVGAVYAGTALGLTMTLSRLGGFISPPLGNSLASPANPSLPFILWAAMGIIALFGCAFVKETGWRRK